MTGVALRAATREDAGHLARLVNIAGEGLPLHVWTQLAREGEDPWRVGETRAARDSGAFSWANALIAERDGAVAAAMVSYQLGETPEPVASDAPAMFRPLAELESLAPSTLYVNVLATYPTHRGQGAASALMQRAAEMRGRNGVSLIVSDANTDARRLYRRLSFAEVARRPMVKGTWRNPGRDWVLMTRP